MGRAVCAVHCPGAGLLRRNAVSRVHANAALGAASAVDCTLHHGGDFWGVSRDAACDCGGVSIGIWLGLMAWRSGSIWPGIACHALVNGLWNVRSMGVRFEVFPARPPLALLIALGIAGVVAFGWSLRIMFGRRGPL